MSSNALKQTKVEAFAEEMVEVLNHGALALMLSIGQRTGLLETMAGLPSSTSVQIAEAAGLQERNVREWLGAMVTGRIVEYDPATQRYQLPPEHAASLTQAAGPHNLAVTAQFLPLISMVEDRIVDSFRRGGGVPYEAYPRFQQVMAEQSSQTVAMALVDTILPMVPGLVDRLQAGIDVLEVGCGRGHSLDVMAEAFPNSRFTGKDLSAEGVAAAMAEASRLGLLNVHFTVQDVTTLDASAQYDLIAAFDAIHDQAQPARVLSNIAKALRPDGVFLMQDIRGASDVHQNLDHPLAPFLYTLSCLHCMTVSLALGGAGLGTMWGEDQARQMLAEAGFPKVDVKQLPHDIVNNYYIAQKS